MEIGPDGRALFPIGESRIVELVTPAGELDPAAQDRVNVFLAEGFAVGGVILEGNGLLLYRQTGIQFLEVVMPAEVRTRIGAAHAGIVGAGGAPPGPPRLS